MPNPARWYIVNVFDRPHPKAPTRGFLSADEAIAWLEAKEAPKRGGSWGDWTYAKGDELD